MATDFDEGAFQPNFASFRINVKTVRNFRRDSPFNVLFRKQICIWMGLPDFTEG